MKLPEDSLHRLSLCALIAAIYAGATVLFSPISFGVIQCRIAEALCVFPFVFPQSVWGLFIGCLIANFLSGNIFDILYGSLATLLAAFCTAAIGKRGRSKRHRPLACLMPVFFNSLIVGAVITGEYEGKNIAENLGLYALNAGYIAAGEALVMYALGLPLLNLLIKKLNIE